LLPESFSLPKAGRRIMRACFLGQNICNLGYGVAILQALRQVTDEPARPQSGTDSQRDLDHVLDISGNIPGGAQSRIPEALIGSLPVANTPRPQGQATA
jgi:hypothetical protein